MTMVSMKVVLSASDGKRELELGPFNQGVVLSYDDNVARHVIVDVASGKTIAWQFSLEAWGADANAGWSEASPPIYGRAFIQTYPSDSPTHAGGDVGRTLMSCIDTREIKVPLAESTERRLRIMAEEVDAEFKRIGDEHLERDEHGVIVDSSLVHCIRACVDRGLEAYEAERGVEAKLDGRVVPLDGGA
jgi:hypothetical protein